MNMLLLRTYLFVHQVIEREEGQDLVEYALIVALISLAAVTGMKALAGNISTAFTTVGTTLAGDV